MELPTIQEEYDAYLKGSYAKELPKDQYVEMRRAFFAGMAILYNRFSEIQKLPVKEGKFESYMIRREICKYFQGEGK